MFVFFKLYKAATETVQTAKVLLRLEYHSSEKKFDPTFSSLISPPP